MVGACKGVKCHLRRQGGRDKSWKGQSCSFTTISVQKRSNKNPQLPVLITTLPSTSVTGQGFTLGLKLLRHEFLEGERHLKAITS